MTLSITLLASVLSASVVSAILLTLFLLLTFKKLSKLNQASKAKELKLNKTIDYLIENAKAINSRLQLEETKVAKKLDSFNVEQELVDNFVINAKASKKELSEKDIKKATKLKIY